MKNEYYFNLTYKCNNRCVFCASYRDEKVPDITPEQFSNICNYYNIKSGDTIVLNGGEPTTLRGIKEIITIADNRKARIVLFTNGQNFSSLHFATDVLSHSHLYEIQVPIHGDRSTHDILTGKSGNWFRTLKGLNNIFSLRRDDTRVIIKFLLCKLNYKLLPDTISFIMGEWKNIDGFVFSSLRASKKMLRNRKQLVFPLSAAEPYIYKALSLCKTQRIRVFLDALPACAIGENNYEIFNKINMEEDDGRALSLFYFDGKTIEASGMGIKYDHNFEGQLEKGCVICRYYNECFGLFKSYADLIGTQDIKPLRYLDYELVGDK